MQPNAAENKLFEFQPFSILGPLSHFLCKIIFKSLTRDDDEYDGSMTVFRTAFFRWTFFRTAIFRPALFRARIISSRIFHPDILASMSFSVRSISRLYIFRITNSSFLHIFVRLFFYVIHYNICPQPQNSGDAYDKGPPFGFGTESFF